ncbi:MAG: hypothetical protein JNL11_08870 [Bdellovibrionaceae bacterium]|nr:hypothetical protein [Pseudobdellovibrionaceae bacterium]
MNVFALNFLKKWKMPLLVASILCLTTPVSAGEMIKVFSWWDFISPEAIAHFKNKGLQLDITEYRSNEVALSKLLSKNTDFDIVIVSNWVSTVLEQNDVIDSVSLNQIVKKRDYFPFIKEAKAHFSCIPYLWAVTAYVADTSEAKVKNMNLKTLESLKSKGFNIGIIDDPMEFGAIALLSYDEACTKKLSSGQLFDGIDMCGFPSSSSISNAFKPADFRNSIKPLVDRKSALYGWSGELGEAIENLDFMNFVEPNHKPIVGFDSVCILKKHSGNTKLIKLVEELTGKEITKINAEKMQYFSAYQNLKVNYGKKIENLKRNTLERAKKETPIVLSPPPLATQKKLNDWWQKIRYGKN